MQTHCMCWAETCKPTACVELKHASPPHVLNWNNEIALFMENVLVVRWGKSHYLAMGPVLPVRVTWRWGLCIDVTGPFSFVWRLFCVGSTLQMGRERVYCWAHAIACFAANHVHQFRDAAATTRSERVLLLSTTCSNIAGTCPIALALPG